MKNFANNAATRAINAMVLAHISYEAALEIVRAELKADRISVADAKLCFAKALAHHAPSKYAKSLTADGGIEHGSALAGKVASMIRDIKGNQRNTKKASDSIEVPRAVQKLADELVALCSEYEGTAKLIATAIANAKAK